MISAAVVWFSAAVKAAEPFVIFGKSLISVTVTVNAVTAVALEESVAVTSTS